ncbi:hypothetical protein [Undibacterium sp. TJN19]|uniref:hypothetical protein n=1 Tax=Undibacterium sp. TJN19 TaxID=3413055 RepID=UPI003BF201EC
MSFTKVGNTFDMPGFWQATSEILVFVQDDRPGRGIDFPSFFVALQIKICAYVAVPGETLHIAWDLLLFYG